MGTHSLREKVIFLDLELSVGAAGYTTHRIHRKPKCAYFYTPAASCHRRQNHTGLICGEVTRAFRLCRTRGDATRDILFFCRKMARRGFEHSEIKKIAFHHFKKLSHRGDFKDFAAALAKHLAGPPSQDQLIPRAGACWSLGGRHTVFQFRAVGGEDEEDAREVGARGW